jgi:hypothetical protein
MRIAITTTGEITRYAVKDGQIHYVKLSKPCVVSDLDDPFAKPDITPYMGRRTVYYGVFVDDPNGYSARAKNIKRVSNIQSENAQEVFEMCCSHYGCNLSWEDARKLAGWD